MRLRLLALAVVLMIVAFVPMVSAQRDDNAISVSDKELGRLTMEVEIVGGMVTIALALGGSVLGFFKWQRSRDVRMLAREKRFNDLRAEFRKGDEDLLNKFEMGMVRLERNVLHAIDLHRDEARNELQHVIKYTEIASSSIDRVDQRLDAMTQRLDKFSDNWDGQSERRSERQNG